jgi:NADH dehydrogenase
MISSLGTRAQASAIYHKTKWLAEEIIRKSEIPFLILRPALIVGRIFGRRNSKLVDRYFKLIRDKQTVPLIAGGGNLVQPIFIADVVKAVLAGIAHSVEDKSIFGQSLDIGGPEQITMRNFVERMAIEVCGEKRNFRSISPLAAQMAAFFCEMVQDVPLISLDQVKLSAENNICHDNALESVLKVSPMSLSSAFASYIVHPINAQFDTPLKVS